MLKKNRFVVALFFIFFVWIHAEAHGFKGWAGSSDMKVYSWIKGKAIDQFKKGKSICG